MLYFVLWNISKVLTCRGSSIMNSHVYSSTNSSNQLMCTHMIHNPSHSWPLIIILLELYLAHYIILCVYIWISDRLFLWLESEGNFYAIMITFFIVCLLINRQREWKSFVPLIFEEYDFFCDLCTLFFLAILCNCLNKIWWSCALNFFNEVKYYQLEESQ